MVTMMATTTTNSNRTSDRQPYFYDCCSTHPPPSYFNLDEEENIDKSKMFIKPCTSAISDGLEENDQASNVKNNNDWTSSAAEDKAVDHGASISINDDDGKNNNYNFVDNSRRVGVDDTLNSNISSSTMCVERDETDTLANSCNIDDDYDEAASQQNLSPDDGDEKKFESPTCVRSKFGRSTTTTTAKQRAKSADIYSSMAASIDESSTSSYFYCKYAASPASLDADSTTSINGNRGTVGSVDATSLSTTTPTTTTVFRLVPTCRALRMAVLALYRLDDFDRTKIGQGFFSEVFKVRHKVTGEQLALKLNTMSSNRPNVLREVQIMRLLKHPNVLRFRGVCVDKGQLHALTEYCNGGSLEQLIKGGSNTGGASTGSNASLTPFPWLIRANLAADIARGMQYVHSRGYIHRDLTSKNVLLKRDDYGGVPYRYTAIIADFGLSCKIPKPSTKVAAVGTPYWMAPECLNDELYTEISDVFSNGIILCEMIGRIDADPDFMPRTSTFGLDYVKFSELCPLDTPVDFLKLAFRCCLMDPNSRPNFDQIVQLALNLVKSLQEPPAPALLPRQISHVLAANGVSPTHYATMANTPSYANGKENACYYSLNNQRYAITNGARMQYLPSPPSKLVRCHSDIGISGSDEANLKSDSNENDSLAKTGDDERTSQSPSSALNRALAHRIAADDPFYKPSDDGESVNPFAGDQRFAGGKKIVTESCYASPSVLGNLDGPPLASIASSNLLANGLGPGALGIAGCHRRFTIWKQCHGVAATIGVGGPVTQGTPPMRRAHSLPCSPIVPTSAKQSNGFLYVDVKEIGDCCPATLDSSDDQTTKQESPNHVQVRRVTQVFEEQDKLFVDNRQKQKKSMKKAVTLSAVDGGCDGASPTADADTSVFTFCVPPDSMTIDKEEKMDKDDFACGVNRMESTLTDQETSDSKRTTPRKRVERVKRSSRRQRKRKECSAADDETNVEPSCGGSLQNSCTLL